MFVAQGDFGCPIPPLAPKAGAPICAGAPNAGLPNAPPELCAGVAGVAALPHAEVLLAPRLVADPNAATGSFEP